MPHTLTIEVPDAFAEAWRSLRPASQDTLVQFAQFLKTREAQDGLEPVAEAEETEWDKVFADPAKLANFHCCADRALAEGPSEPLDLSRL